MDSKSTVWALHGRLVPDGEHSRIDIDVLPFLIGRRGDLNLTLRSGAVSGLHAQIDERDGVLWIRDLNSKNGTFVNGVRIKHEVTLAENDLVQIADTPFRLAKAECAHHSTVAAENDQGALALVQLNALLHTEDFMPVYQPIVDFQSGDVCAFEALARSRLIGLETPAAIFGAAAHLGMEADISHLMRIKAISKCCVYEQLPHLFVNTHPAELANPDFHTRLMEMRAVSPFQQLTLEIHEAALTNIEVLMQLRELLVAQGIKLAFDDFGVGQARIAELAAVSPDYVKFDRTLITGINAANPERLRVLRCLVGALNEINVTPLAEGIETQAEAEICRELGFRLGQGFYFGRPASMDHFHERVVSASVPRCLSGHSANIHCTDDTASAEQQILRDALKAPLDRLSSTNLLRELERAR